MEISLLLKGGGGSRTPKMSILVLSLLLKGGGGNMRLGQCPSICSFFLKASLKCFIQLLNVINTLMNCYKLEFLIC